MKIGTVSCLYISRFSCFFLVFYFYFFSAAGDGGRDR